MRILGFILFVAFEVALLTTPYLFPEGLEAIYVYASYFLVVFLAVVYGLLWYFPNALASANILLRNIGGAILSVEVWISKEEARAVISESDYAKYIHPLASHRPVGIGGALVRPQMSEQDKISHRRRLQRELEDFSTKEGATKEVSGSKQFSQSKLKEFLEDRLDAAIEG